MRRLPVVLALGLLAACGGDPAPAAGGGSPGGGDGDLFVLVDTSGGLVAPGSLFGELPRIVVYADGTVLVPGASGDVFPRAAVTPLRTGRLDEGATADLVREAEGAGLLAATPPDLDGGSQVIADGPTTTIHVVVDGDDHVASAYALGLVTPESGARAQALSFVDAVQAAADDAADADFDPTAYVVLPSEPYDSTSGVEPNRLDWPAGLPALTVGTCIVVDGAAAGTLEAVLPEATQITRWESGGGSFALSIRPLLPHEHGCDAATG
jgi:hypothetical protein